MTNAGDDGTGRLAAGDDGLDRTFRGLAVLLAEAANLGEGTILGLVPAGRAGVRRVSRAKAEEFDRRLAEAYRDRFPLLVRHAARKVGDHGRAEDVVHRAFEKILRGYKQDRPEITNIHAYVFTSVSNEINGELRTIVATRRSQVAEDTVDTAGLPAMRTDVSTRVVDALSVRAALGTLPPREREAVVLRMQWQLSVNETAEVMGLSAGAIKRYTADGLRRLKERLGT